MATALASKVKVRAEKRKAQHKTVSDWIVDIVIATLLVLIVASVIYPLWFIIIASFSDPALVAQGKVVLVPQGVNFKGYEKIIMDERIWTGYRNTIIYSLLGTAVNLLVTLPTAFALSRVVA